MARQHDKTFNILCAVGGGLLTCVSIYFLINFQNIFKPGREVVMIALLIFVLCLSSYIGFNGIRGIIDKKKIKEQLLNKERPAKKTLYSAKGTKLYEYEGKKEEEEKKNLSMMAETYTENYPYHVPDIKPKSNSRFRRSRVRSTLNPYESSSCDDMRQVIEVKEKRRDLTYGLLLVTVIYIGFTVIGFSFRLISSSSLLLFPTLLSFLFARMVGKYLDYKKSLLMPLKERVEKHIDRWNMVKELLVFVVVFSFSYFTLMAIIIRF